MHANIPTYLPMFYALHDHPDWLVGNIAQSAVGLVQWAKRNWGKRTDHDIYNVTQG